MAGLVSDQSRGEEQLCSSICPFYVPPSTGWEETIVRTRSISFGNFGKEEEGSSFFGFYNLLLLFLSLSLGQEKYFSTAHGEIDISFLTLFLSYSINWKRGIIPRVFVIRVIEISNFICYENA